MNFARAFDSTLRAVTALIGVRTGLVFPPNRHKDVEIGLRKIMAASGIVDPGQYLGRLQSDQALLDELISRLTIGETYFFREPGHFALIRDDIACELLRVRGAGHVLRVWSAGCATGEEAYSLAILFEEMGLAASARLLATDISRTALARARRAFYSRWSFRGEGERLIGPYVDCSDGLYKLTERFRRRVEFAYLNLARDFHLSAATKTSGMDLILCRNVLIYLDATTIRDIARRFYDSLADEGVLITSSTDPLLANYAPYETETTPAGIVYRKSPRAKGRTPITSAVKPSSRFIGLISPVIPSHLADLPAIGPFSPVERHVAKPHPLISARESLERGDNGRAFELASPLKMDAEAVMLCMRALANLGDCETAVAVAADATKRHLASPELLFLLAVILINRDRHEEAGHFLGRVIYLDRSLAIAHFTLGATLRGLGDVKGALRAYGKARDLAAGRPAEEIVPLSDGEKAGRLAAAATVQIASLQVRVESGR